MFRTTIITYNLIFQILKKSRRQQVPAPDLPAEDSSFFLFIMVKVSGSARFLISGYSSSGWIDRPCMNSTVISPLARPLSILGQRKGINLHEYLVEARKADQQKRPGEIMWRPSCSHLAMLSV